MPTNRISDNKKRAIRNMVIEGFKTEVIADDLGVSKSTVVKIRKEVVDGD